MALRNAIVRRAMPRVIFLDENLRITFAGPEAADTIARVAEPANADRRLPPSLESAVANVLQDWNAGTSEREISINPLPGLVLRVSRLAGKAGFYVAVFIEGGSRRDDAVTAP